jgi:hypothetical protein
MPDARKQHKAVILMNIEIHEVLDSGECSGKPVSAEELKKFGITGKSVQQLTGENKDDCLKKLKRLIDEFK